MPKTKITQKQLTPLSKLIVRLRDPRAVKEKFLNQLILEEKQIFIGAYLQAAMQNHGLPYGLEYHNLLASKEAEAEKYFEDNFKQK